MMRTFFAANCSGRTFQQQCVYIEGELRGAGAKAGEAPAHELTMIECLAAELRKGLRWVLLALPQSSRTNTGNVSTLAVAAFNLLCARQIPNASRPVPQAR